MGHLAAREAVDEGGSLSEYSRDGGPLALSMMTVTRFTVVNGHQAESARGGSGDCRKKDTANGTANSPPIVDPI